MFAMKTGKRTQKKKCAEKLVDEDCTIFFSSFEESNTREFTQKLSQSEIKQLIRLTNLFQKLRFATNIKVIRGSIDTRANHAATKEAIRSHHIEHTFGATTHLQQRLLIRAISPDGGHGGKGLGELVCVSPRNCPGDVFSSCGGEELGGDLVARDTSGSKYNNVKLAFRFGHVFVGQTLEKKYWRSHNQFFSCVSCLNRSYYGLEQRCEVEAISGRTME
jgi:hypothetical protein